MLPRALLTLGLLLELGAGALLCGCWERLPIDPHGFQCTTSAQCGGSLACVKGRCDDANQAELSFPIRAAFFKLDYPFSWKLGTERQAHQSASLGDYVSIDALSAHLQAFEYAGIQVAITYWWGNGSPTDSALGKFMTASTSSSLRWAALYMRETADHPAGTTLAHFLTDVRIKFVGLPNYLRVDGKPVLFVLSDAVAPTCELADRWATAGASAGVYVVLRPSAGMSKGFVACAAQPAAWFQFDSAKAEVAQGDSIAISPGQWVWNVAEPALARDSSRWQTSVEHVAASTAKFQLVTSFNDWADGSAVESGTEWGSSSGFGVYLDALHAHPNAQ